MKENEKVENLVDLVLDEADLSNILPFCKKVPTGEITMETCLVGDVLYKGKHCSVIVNTDGPPLLIEESTVSLFRNKEKNFLFSNASMGRTICHLLDENYRLIPFLCEAGTFYPTSSTNNQFPSWLNIMQIDKLTTYQHKKISKKETMIIFSNNLHLLMPTSYKKVVERMNRDLLIYRCYVRISSFLTRGDFSKTEGLIVEIDEKNSQLALPQCQLCVSVDVTIVRNHLLRESIVENMLKKNPRLTREEAHQYFQQCLFEY